MNLKSVLLIVLCTTAIACNKQYPPKNVRTNGAEDALQLGKFFMEKNNPTEARREFSRIILYFPTSKIREKAHFLFAKTYFMENSWREAADAFDEYLMNYPNGKFSKEAENLISTCIHRMEQLRLAQKLPVVKITPPDRSYTKIIRNVRATWYWIEDEKDFPSVNMVSVIDKNGNVIAKVPKTFYRRLSIEGTGRLKDGRLLNWAAPGRFAVMGPEHPYGMGVKNLPLIPLRTIAVDPSHIPIGSNVYIPQFDGLVLPGGKRHDGCFTAHDIGSAIKGEHIDIFVHNGRLGKRLLAKVPEYVTVIVGHKKCRKTYSPFSGFFPAPTYSR